MKNIAQIFQTSAEQFGSKPALISDGLTLSYTELAERSLRLAAALVVLGVKPGDRITLYSPNCWEWIVSYYGGLMAGAVVNPINVMLTPEEVGHIAKDCGASVVMGSQEKLVSIVELKNNGTVRDLICFGDSVPAGMTAFAQLVEQGDVSRFSIVEREAQDSCTIGYTSGTTGHPKGAVHSHQNVVMNAQLTALMHGRSEADCVVTALPLPHVYGTVVMNSTFINGGTLVVHPRFDEVSVLTSIQQYKATLFEGVPTMYFFLLNHPDLNQFDLSSLRICTVGGQTMPVAKMQQVEEQFGCPLVELWGMTELAGLGTTFSHNGPIKHGSIGVPLPYCKAKIVDVADVSKTLAEDEVGELMIKGPVVMQGYYGNEAATQETIEGDGWLHTGDVAKIDEDGFIFIVDRKKDLILTAGYNVYPAEIERVVAAHPDVAMVAVGPIADEVKGELAKAYIVPKKNSSPSADSIMDYCREHLAAYKVPRAVQFVDDFPKTSSGKIMRRKLRELDLV